MFLSSAGAQRSTGVTGLMRGQVQSPTAPTCGKPQVSDWCPPSQPQYLHVTSGGHTNATHRQASAASSVHPLVPLLLYSDRHVPPSSPFAQPITSPAHRRSVSYPRHHGNSVARPPAQVKKPLNAFMLYMKETRQQVLQEGRERESAAVNRILGRRWRALTPAQQAKYHELAQRERLLHTQLHPGWSARENYGKRKNRRRQRPCRSFCPDTKAAQITCLRGDGPGPSASGCRLWNHVFVNDDSARRPQLRPPPRPGSPQREVDMAPENVPIETGLTRLEVKPPRRSFSRKTSSASVKQEPAVRPKAPPFYKPPAFL